MLVLCLEGGLFTFHILQRTPGFVSSWRHPHLSAKSWQTAAWICPPCQKRLGTSWRSWTWSCLKVKEVERGLLTAGAILLPFLYVSLKWETETGVKPSASFCAVCLWMGAHLRGWGTSFLYVLIQDVGTRASKEHDKLHCTEERNIRVEAHHGGTLILISLTMAWPL